MDGNQFREWVKRMAARPTKAAEEPPPPGEGWKRVGSQWVRDGPKRPGWLRALDKEWRKVEGELGYRVRSED